MNMSTLTREVADLRAEVQLTRSDVRYMREDLSEVVAAGRDQATRIGRLERWRWTVAGGMGALLLVADHLAGLIR